MIKFITKRTSRLERVVHILMLTEFTDWNLVTHAVTNWTPKQRILAYEWATREHLIANDNKGIRRLKCPKHVEKLRKDHGPIKY